MFFFFSGFYEELIKVKPGKWDLIHKLFIKSITSSYTEKTAGYTFARKFATMNRDQIIYLLTKWNICTSKINYSKFNKSKLSKMFVDELKTNVLHLGFIPGLNEKEKCNKSTKNKKKASYASYFCPSDCSDDEEEKVNKDSFDTSFCSENKQNVTKNTYQKIAIKNDPCFSSTSYVTIDTDIDECNIISPYTSSNSATSSNSRGAVTESIYDISNDMHKSNFIYKTPPPAKKHCSLGRHSFSTKGKTSLFKPASEKNENFQFEVPTISGGSKEDCVKSKSAISSKTALQIYMDRQKKIGEKKKLAQIEKNEQLKKQGEGKLKIVIGRSKIVSEYDDIRSSDFGEHKFVVVVDMIDVRRNLVLWCYNGDYMVEALKIFAIEASEVMYSDKVLSLFRRDNNNANSIMTTPTQFPMKGVCLCVVCHGYPQDAEEKFSLISSQLQEFIAGSGFYDKYKAGVDGYFLANPTENENGQTGFKDAMDRFIEKKQAFYWLKQKKDHFFDVQTDVDLSMYFRDEDITNNILPILFKNLENHDENPFKV